MCRLNVIREAMKISSVAIPLVLVVVTVAVCEVAARVLDWQVPPEADIGTIRYGYTPAGLGDYHPGQDGVYITHRHWPFHVRTNADGFRDRGELRNDRYRVLALGDSQTFGLFVNSQDVWTDWLTYYLNKGSDSKVEVLNNGIPGGTITDELEYFTDKGQALGAQLVILCVYANDIKDLKRPASGRSTGIAVERNVAFSGLRWFLGHYSAAYSLARSVKERLTRSHIRNENRALVASAGADGVPEMVLDPSASSNEDAGLRDRYRELFSDFAQKVSKSGSHLLVAYLPSFQYGQPESGDRDTGVFVAGLAARHGAAFVDLTPAIASRPVEEMFLLRLEDQTAYPSDIHLSRSGHMVVAATLAETVSHLRREDRQP